MTVHLMDLRSDVLLCFTPFYLYTFTFVMLTKQIVSFVWEF